MWTVFWSFFALFDPVEETDQLEERDNGYMNTFLSADFEIRKDFAHSFRKLSMEIQAAEL